jgi:hypothetical protein
MVDPPPRGSQDMSEKPKRPWFRFHLLTAVLMICVVAALIGLNLRKFTSYTGSGITTGEYGITGRTSEDGKSYGLPYNFVTVGCERHLTPDEQPLETKAVFKFDFEHLCLDVLIWGVITFAVAFLSESILRRREARKT